MRTMVMNRTSKMTSSQRAAREPFLPLLRELVGAYQAFQAFDAAKIREFGLTSAQADVVFTLGNTEGLACGELGEKTLITKGTLTGVVDRLEAKRLVRRVAHPEDRRSTIIRLTPAGEELFERVFPLQIAHLGERLRRLSPRQLKDTERALRRLRRLF